MNHTYFSQDVQDFLECLAKHEVDYVIVGGEVVIYHGHARLTGDIDIFYRLEESNVEMLFAALTEFWSGDIPEIDTPEQLSHQGMIIQFGLPPNRIDLLNDLSGISFEEVWKNKEAANRPKDADDLK